MSMLLLAFALAAPAAPVSYGDARAEKVTCSVDVHALDRQGRARPARLAAASASPALVFRGKLSLREREQDDEAAPRTLLFDVFNPRGQRYQILVATPRVVVRERGALRIERTSRVREAAMAVAGSSIAWTSMYGKWRVEPRIEGESQPCGRAQFFTIRP